MISDTEKEIWGWILAAIIVGAIITLVVMFRAEKEQQKMLDIHRSLGYVTKIEGNYE